MLYAVPLQMPRQSRASPLSSSVRPADSTGNYSTLWSRSARGCIGTATAGTPQTTQDNVAVCTLLPVLPMKMFTGPSEDGNRNVLLQNTVATATGRGRAAPQLLLLQLGLEVPQRQTLVEMLPVVTEPPIIMV